jgi:uncharacterized protein YndB with AHSA1/START domain
MTHRSNVHATFTIDRIFPFERHRVFAAFASVEAKSQWFVGPSGWTAQHREMDFRVGGREQLIGRRPNGTTSKFDARYHEIVPDVRIVYVYDMYTNDVRTSVSLATLELKDEKDGTRLLITEQGVFFDGLDDPRAREHGTGILIDQLGRYLRPRASNLANPSGAI